MRYTSSLIKSATILFAIILTGCQSPTSTDVWPNVWTNIGLKGRAINSIAIDPATPTTLYAMSGINSAVFKSTDDGANWSVIRTDRATYWTLAIDLSTSTTLYATTSDGLLKSTDGGASWNAVNTDMTSFPLAIDPVTPTTLYAGSLDSVLKSTDGGANWSAFNTGLTVTTDIYILAIDPATPTTLYAGTSIEDVHRRQCDGVFKSTNGGTNWSAVNNGLTDSCVRALAIDPATPTTLYAGTKNTGVFKSTDGGANWSAVNNGLIDTNVYALAIDPTTPTTLYAGTWCGGVFRSKDDGANWLPLNTGLTDTCIYTLVIDSMTPTTLYAGTRTTGVFALRIHNTTQPLIVEGKDNTSQSLIIAGKGWGKVSLGVDRKTVEGVIGEGQNNSWFNDVYFIDYPAQGIQISYNNANDTLHNVYFYNKEHGYENFSTFQGKTDRGVDWKSTPDDVIKAYGKPKEDYKGDGWRRMVFDGIDFRWENGVMVRIGIPGN